MGEKVRIPARGDRFPLGGELFLPEGRPKAVVLIAGAMAVRASFYAPLASHVAAQGAAALIVGGRLENHQRVFSECLEAAREKDSPWAMPYERELPVWLCRNPKESLASIWPRVKHYE